MSVNVLVVDDSAFMRRVISDMLKADKEINVIGISKNGKDALEKIEVLKPDVITLDVEMPIMDGLQTLENIMKKYKIPVVMLSSITVEGADATLKALELGAVDFIAKPTNIFDMNNAGKKDELINKVKAAVNARISNSISFRPNSEINIKKKYLSSKNYSNKDTKISNLIAIGTSTGGPRALQEIIPFIPEDINGCILVVQHMPPGFTKSLANRLNSMSNIIVKEAEDGEKLLRGYCYIAPGDCHMRIEEKNNIFSIRLGSDEPVSGHRPSVDVLMESVAKHTTLNTYGVILTGMGCDGAKGIKKVLQNNGYTIAQDEETCVIYGMPKVAVKLEAIKKILPLNKIAKHLIEKVGV